MHDSILHVGKLEWQGVHSEVASSPGRFFGNTTAGEKYAFFARRSWTRR